MATLHADAGSAAAESTYREGDRETGKETSIETGKKEDTEEHGGWQRDRHIHALFGHIPRREKERERGWSRFAAGRLSLFSQPENCQLQKWLTNCTHTHSHAHAACLCVCASDFVVEGDRRREGELIGSLISIDF